MQRNTARGIVIHDGKILLMERWRDGMHYFSIPGGGIEAGEKPEETVVREILEEMSVVVGVERQLYEMQTPDGCKHYIFLCSYKSGEPRLAEDSEEAKAHAGGKNLFQPGWQPLEALSELPFTVWKPIQEQLLEDLKNGFSKDIKTLALDQLR